MCPNSTSSDQEFVKSGGSFSIAESGVLPERRTSLDATHSRLMVAALCLVSLQFIATATFVGYFMFSLQQVQQTSVTKLRECLVAPFSEDSLCQEFLYYMDDVIVKKSREAMSSQIGDQKASSSNPAGIPGHAASKGRPIAHVTGKQPRDASVMQAREGEHLQKLLGLQGGKVLFSWEEKLGSVHLQHMEFTGATLTARVPGAYYAYAQTYFRFSTHRGHHDLANPSSSSQRQVQTMVLYLYKRTDHYPKPLLLAKAAQTKCWSSAAQYGLHSVQLGGVFSLRQGDQLFVAVSDPTLVDFDPEASFFGSFLLQ